VLVFVFYALPASKRGVYLLPLYPALSLLLACRFESLLRGESRARVLRAIVMVAGGGLAAVSIAGALAAAGHAFSTPVLPALGVILPDGGGSDFQRVADIVSAHGRELACVFAAAALTSLVIFLSARNQRWRLTFASIIVTVGILAVSVRVVILPGLAQQRTRRNFVAEVRSALADPDQLSAYRSFDYGMVYYWGEPIPMQHIPLSSSGPRYLVMSESQWARLGEQERRFYERLPGIESDRGGNLGRLIVAQRIDPPPSASN
jgi:hypothetical protein